MGYDFEKLRSIRFLVPERGRNSWGLLGTNLGRLIIREVPTLAASGRSRQHQLFIRKEFLGYRSLGSFGFPAEGLLKPRDAFSIVIALVIVTR